MSSHFAAAFFLVKIAIRHIAFKTVELNFVSEGKLKYPGVNSKLFGNNIQVETEDEARNRLLQRIYLTLTQKTPSDEVTIFLVT